MSVTLVEPKATLDDSQRAWLQRMSQVLNVNMISRQPDIVPAVVGRAASTLISDGGVSDQPANSAPANGIEQRAQANGQPPSASESELETNRGLQTLYLTSYSPKSAKNLAKLLAAADANQVVTLAICPYFDRKKAAKQDKIEDKIENGKAAANAKRPDLYKNVKMVIRRVHQKGKKLALTVFLGFQDKASDLATQSELLGEFLVSPVLKDPAVTFLNVLHKVAISPKLEDKYNDETVGTGQAKSNFEKAVQVIAENVPAEVLKAPHVEIRRSVAGKESPASITNDRNPNNDDPKNPQQEITVTKDGVTIPLKVTHEFHHDPANADNYQVYASDGPFVFNPATERSTALGPTNVGDANDPEDDNPDAQTIDEFIAAVNELPDDKQALLWRPNYNLQHVSVGSDGKVDEYGYATNPQKRSAFGIYDRKDISKKRDERLTEAFDQTEVNIAAKFLGIDLPTTRNKSKKGSSR
jgi:hypothetical protein